MRKLKAEIESRLKKNLEDKYKLIMKHQLEQKDFELKEKKHQLEEEVKRKAEKLFA